MLSSHLMLSKYGESQKRRDLDREPKKGSFKNYSHQCENTRELYGQALFDSVPNTLRKP